MKQIKSFFEDHENQSILKKWNGENQEQIIRKWNDEVPKHVENFNNYKEDRNAVIYFALFIENEVDKIILILFPDFDFYFSKKSTFISQKLKILDSFKLFPKQILKSARCINNIRNEFAHNIKIENFDDLESLEGKRKKDTINSLITLTNEYEGDYNYEKNEDTLKNRFKSLCLNTVTALRIYNPIIKDLRENKIEK